MDKQTRGAVVEGFLMLAVLIMIICGLIPISCEKESTDNYNIEADRLMKEQDSLKIEMNKNMRKLDSLRNELKKGDEYISTHSK